MLAKVTSENQLTLPQAVTAAAGGGEHHEVQARAGQTVLTPVRLQRADAVRGKLATLGLSASDVAAAVSWARHDDEALNRALRCVRAPWRGQCWTRTWRSRRSYPALDLPRRCATPGSGDASCRRRTGSS